MTQAVDLLDFIDAHSDEPNAAEEYRALVRSLRRKQGFGLFFVQASPAKGQEILTELRRDLPGKRLAEVKIGRTDDRLFDRLEAMWKQEPVDIFWIEGLEQSLLGYEDMQRLAGWDEQDLMTYSWKDVPPILSHLNLGRERFEARFDCALVFVVPLFVVKYLLRRAGDFFDWKSGFFEFPADRNESVQRIMKNSDYGSYLKLDSAERTQKILQIKDLLDVAEIDIDRRARLLQQVGRLFESGAEFEKAMISYGHAIQIKPDFSDAWCDQGDVLGKLGRYEEEITAYEKAILLNPHDTEVYDRLGIAHYEQEDYTSAITAYEKAIALNHHDAETYNRLGVAYKNQKDYSAAIKAYKDAISLNAQFSYPYNNLGAIYKEQEHYEDAIYWLEKALSLPDSYGMPETAHTLAYKSLGHIYTHQKDYAAAITAYQRAIELNPDLDQAFAHRGEAYRLTKCYEEALKDFNRAIKLDPEYAWAITSRGQTYQALKNYDAALKDFDQVIKLGDEDFWVIGKRGEIYLQLNQTEKAVEDFERAIELDPDDWYFHLRAIAHFKLNQAELAETDFQKAISISTLKYEKDPIDYRNTFNLALYHLAAAHPEESDRLYTSNLTAPIEWLQMAIDDLDDFLHLFPDRSQAQQVKQLLQRSIEAIQSIAL
jgi:tetratricopeptide (TPR) repeat protein